MSGVLERAKWTIINNELHNANAVQCIAIAKILRGMHDCMIGLHSTKQVTYSVTLGGLAVYNRVEQTCFHK